MIMERLTHGSSHTYFFLTRSSTFMYVFIYLFIYLFIIIIFIYTKTLI